MIEISPEISGEALRFLRFMLVGFLLILAFDLLRILRRLIPHRTGMVAVEDMLYCIGSAIFILCSAGKMTEQSGAFACWA